MSFDVTALTPIYMGGKGGHKFWSYVSTDSVATMAGAGYFTAPASQLQAGDVIEAIVVNSVGAPTSATALARFFITSVTAAGVATVSDYLDVLADPLMVLKGTWDASSGSFPGAGAAQAGWSYIVSVGGTVDSVVFTANDRIVAIVDNASASTYAANWHKLDYTDQVLSVAGRTGAVVLAAADLSDASANAISLITAANYAAMRGLLDLESGTDFLSPAAIAAAYAAIAHTHLEADITDLQSYLLPTDIGVSVQAYDAQLDTWATLAPSANFQTLVTQTFAQIRGSLDLEAGVDFYSVAGADAAFAAISHTHAVADLSDASANAKSLLQAANYAAMRGLLDLEAGTDFLTPAAIAAAYQPLDGDLTALAAAGNSTVLAATTASFLTADETKLDGIEALADVTDAANVAAAGALMQGVHTIWIPASAMWPRATSGAGEGTYDSGASDVTIKTLAFDTTTQEYAHFHAGMPKSWNEGTITFIPYWTNTGGASTETVVWSLAGRALGNDDAINGAFGTVQTSTDTWLAQNDMHIGPESAAITIGNTPAENDLVAFEVSRVVGSDNMAGDAQLIGIKIIISFSAGTDA